MDKYEYRIRAEEINALIEQKDYIQAVKIADTIDWRRVRSVVMLCKVSELYKINRRYEESKEVLLLAYDLQPGSRKIVYSLCELSIKLEETVQAVEYYKEFIQIAPRDTGRFILQYRLYEAQDVSLEERIAVLEEYKKRDYREKWAYELAYLYHRIGLATRCVEECDELVLWFGEGKYVIKALELKMLHAPLTPEQQEKYNARFAVPEPEEKVQEEQEPSMPIEIKSVEAAGVITAEIPTKEVEAEIEAEDLYPQEEAETEKEAAEEEPEEPEISAESEDMESVDSAETEADEDADMKIVSPDIDDIQVKTIDVGDEYSTINLQEALAKNIAEMLAEEDMEASDATKALPVDSIFQATTQKIEDMPAFREEEKKEEQEAEPAPESVEEEATGIENTEQDNESAEVAEISSEEKETVEEPEEEVSETEVSEEIPEMEELEEIEEAEPVEESAEEPETAAEQEPEQESIEKKTTEGITEVEDTEPVEITEISTEEESVETEEVEEIPGKEEPEDIKPLLFGGDKPLPEALIQAVQTVAMEVAKEAAKEAAKQAAQEVAHEAVEAIKEMTPAKEVAEEETEAETIKEEETLVKEPEPMVEKQITGQLSFADIMAEWEETKKANEEKHLQEMKQRVLEQTGPLLSDFDAAARASVQSDLDMINPVLDVFSDTDDLATEVEDALKEETAEEKTETEEPVEAEETAAEDVDLPEEESVEDIVASVEQTDYVAEPEQEESVEKNDIESGTETDPVSDEETEETEEELQDRPNKFNTAEINGLEAKLMTALENQHYDTSSMQMQALEEEMEQSEKDSRPEDYISLSEIEKQQEAVLAEKQEEKPDSPKKRTLTKAEKEMFGAIAQTKELQEQIAHALDTISLVPFTGNVIITGDKGTGALTIAQNIALDMRSNDSFTGNTETLTAEELDQKDITTLFEKTANGAIIIDHAGDIKQSVCQSMLKACDEMQGKGILLILTDTKQDMDRLIRMNPKVQDYFNVKIDIHVLDNDGLVNFGREYAREQEYSIDDMGVLALYNRIEERQTNEHAVTVEEVKEIINEAIKHADKKNISHFMDVVFAKRYDKEDMIVLREKDFIKK